MLNHVTVLANPAKRGAEAAGRHLERLFADRAVEASLVRTDGSDAMPDWPEATDLIITLGGDGTILRAARKAAPFGTPILGLHMGRFGFITEGKPEDVEAHVDALIDGRFAVQDRVMVHGSVLRSGEVIHEAVGLNEIVISKGAMTRMLGLLMRIGDGPSMEYLADGAIVATPTGSTAYALSVGGPLMDPNLSALLVAPICPHTLAARPIVLPDSLEVDCVIETDGGEVKFSADGSAVFALIGGDHVRVRRAEFVTRLVVFSAASFYDKVHNRLLWGERVNE